MYIDACFAIAVKTSAPVFNRNVAWTKHRHHLPLIIFAVVEAPKSDLSQVAMMYGSGKESNSRRVNDLVRTRQEHPWAKSRCGRRDM